MKILTMAFFILTSSSFAFAASGSGISTYSTITSPEAPLHGVLTIRGPSAELFFNEMSNIKKLPEVTNLKELDPNQVSLDMLERKYGNNVSCFNRPEIENDQWKIDHDGHLVYVMTCILNFSDATNGTIKTL